MKHVYITGGEPFAYSNPCGIAMNLKLRYKNIESVIVYTNAMELVYYLLNSGRIFCIDGITVSIKDYVDKHSFVKYIAKDERILKLPSNRLYVFPGFEDVECPPQFTKMKREWQKNFVPAPNCIFRKL
jgi:hypothetical protein